MSDVRLVVMHSAFILCSYHHSGCYCWLSGDEPSNIHYSLFKGYHNIIVLNMAVWALLPPAEHIACVRSARQSNILIILQLTSSTYRFRRSELTDDGRRALNAWWLFIRLLLKSITDQTSIGHGRCRRPFSPVMFHHKYTVSQKNCASVIFLITPWNIGRFK